MGYFPTQANFSTRTQYAIRLQVTTSYTPGGTVLSIYNVLVKHTYVNNAPVTAGSPRSYSVTNGRYPNLTSDLSYSSDSDSALTFSFTSGSSSSFVEQIFPIWGGSGTFTRYVREADSIGNVQISASHSLLGSSTATVTVKHVYRTTYDANGGSVGTSYTDADSGNSISLPTPTRSGYNFLGWTSGGTNYGTGTYTVNATRTLVASWQISTPAPVFSNGLNLASVVRVGENWSDSMTASNTYAALGQSGTSYEGITLLPNQGISVIGNTAYLVNPIGAADTGQYTLRVRAYGPGGTADTTATVTLKQALPSWSDTSLADGTKGTFYSSTFSATGATSWVISGEPSGLSASGTSGSTVTISGTPSVYGSQTISATPYNLDGDAGSTQQITFTVADEPLSWSDQILTNSVVTQDESYTDGVSVEAGPTVTYSIFSGALPDGLSLSPSTGAITGTPTVPGTYNFIIRATNGSNETLNTESLSIAVESSGGYVQVKTGSGWANATVYVKTASGWVEGTVNAKSPTGWNPSFSG